MTELRRITERYRLDKLVHASDVASVFRATDRQTGEPVAVKLFSGIDDDPARQREPFSRVTRALQEVRHAAIPRVLDFGFAKGGDAFLVTEFIPGTRLSVLGGSPPERVIALLLPVVSGLEALAERGIYHRNLSADNLLVSPGDRSGEQVKVLGWGKAVLRLAGESWRTDLRALAELACQVMGAPVTGEPEAPRVEVPPTDHAGSGALRRLLESCLRSDHQDAPASYAELGAALRQALRGEGETADSTNPALGGIAQAGATTASSAASSRAATAATAATETGALEAGRPDTALAQLDLLRRAWPERPGLAERIERAEGMRRSDERMDSVLAAAARAEAAGQPLEGLELLAGTLPASRYKERFAGQRQRLEELLARLDAAPPVIALRGGFKLEFEKDKPAAIPLRVTDDLAVKTVECWARPEGGRYQPLAVRHLAAADYEVEVPRELHQNRDVDFYAVATDPSGHRAALGSREKPLKLKRKGWLSRLFGGKGEG